MPYSSTGGVSRVENSLATSRSYAMIGRKKSLTLTKTVYWDRCRVPCTGKLFRAKISSSCPVDCLIVHRTQVLRAQLRLGSLPTFRSTQTIQVTTDLVVACRSIRVVTDYFHDSLHTLWCFCGDNLDTLRCYCNDSSNTLRCFHFSRRP